MDIGKAIKHTRKTLGLTQEELGKKIGVGKSSVSMWESGANPPSGKSLRALADALNVSVAYLLGESELPKGARSIAPSPAAYMPFYGRIHAGDPTEPDDNPDMFAVPVDVYNAHKQGFILKVWGECMNKVYPDGCHVVVDPTITPENGDIGAFTINGDIVMRKVLRGANTLILAPESFNESIQDIVPSGDSEIKTLGKVVWFQAAEEL